MRKQHAAHKITRRDDVVRAVGFTGSVVFDPRRTSGSSTAAIFEIGCNCQLAIDR